MDQQDQENFPKASKTSRREFLKKVGLAGAAMVIGGGPLLTAGLKREQPSKKTPPLEKPPPLEKTPPWEEILSSSPPSPTPLPKESPPQRSTETKLPSPLETFINHCPLFLNCSQEEKKIALSLVENQIKHYQKGYENNPRGLKERLKNSFSWKQTGLIDHAANTLGFRQDSFARDILPALIFVESEGNPRAGQQKLAQDQDAALGLCQLKLSTANELAKKLGMTTPVDLFNPWVSIVLALEFLDQKLKLYPDWSLTTWVYHLGEGNMNRAILGYEISQIHRPILQVEAAFDNPNSSATQQYIKLDSLNFIKLITQPTVTARLKSLGAFGDDTQHYVPRVAAALFLSAENRGLSAHR